MQTDFVVQLVKYFGGELVLVVEVDQEIWGELLFSIAMEGGEYLVQFAAVDGHMRSSCGLPADKRP